MYGLVNKAIEDMVCKNFCEDVWEKIKQTAEVDIDAFISMEAYPDDVTHRLVRAASVVLEMSPQEILQAFGEYWVVYTATEGYGQMLEMGGDNLPEFLQNLDNLHGSRRLKLSEAITTFIPMHDHPRRIPKPTLSLYKAWACPYGGWTLEGCWEKVQDGSRCHADEEPRTGSPS